MGFFLFLATYACIVAIVDPKHFSIIFDSKVNFWVPSLILPSIILLSIAIYYFFQRLILLHFQKQQQFVPFAFQLLTLFLETSIPTLFIYLLSQFHPPLYVMLSSRVLLYFIFIILSALTMDIRLCIFTGVVAAAEYGGLGIYYLSINTIPSLDPYIFNPVHLVTRTLLLFLSGCVTAFVTQQIKKGIFASFKAVEEREQIARIFGRHVSPEVVNMLLSQRRHNISEAKFVCVLFLDIRNFTSYSENKKPQEVVNFLNQIFSFMIEIINKHHGIINKFLGDGFMAVFGAPLKRDNDTDNAVKAAEEILFQVEQEIAKGSIQNTRLGIGIHCGDVVTGNVGAELRQEYTIIGDVVNLASRLEQLNKTYGSQLLISEDVHAGLHEPRGELLGDITVTGRKKPIKIYRLK
jgi:adenylate cyclase